MEIEETNDSLNAHIVRSKKRSLDLFSGSRGAKIPDEPRSLKVKLATKINDEYGLVKEMPPPPKPQSQPKRTPVTESQSRETQKAPITSGDEEPETSRYGHLMESIPRDDRKRESGALVAFKPQDNFVADTKTRTLALRNPYSQVQPDWHPPWKMTRLISGHLGWVRCVAMDPSNEWFCTGAADRTIKIWDLASGTLKLTLTGHINAVRGLAVSQRQPYLFSCAEDKQVKCWDLEYNKVIRHYHGHLSGVYCLSLHPTLDIMVTGGRDSSARVWDIRTKAPIHVLSGHKDTVGAVTCQATDPQVITGSQDNTVRLWDLTTGKTMTTLTHHKKSVRAVAIHPEQYSMVSASPDSIKQFQFPEGKFVKNFAGHQAVINALAVNRDNVLVSGGDNGSIHFWDWKSGYCFQKTQTQVQPGSLESEAGIYAMTFDLTGSRLITCEADKSIKVYKEDDSATPQSHPITDWKASQVKRH